MFRLGKADSGFPPVLGHLNATYTDSQQIVPSHHEAYKQLLTNKSFSAAWWFSIQTSENLAGKVLFKWTKRLQVSALLGHHPMHLGIACCRAAAFYHANCEGLSSVLGAATLVSSFASNRSISIHIDPYWSFLMMMMMTFNSHIFLRWVKTPTSGA